MVEEPKFKRTAPQEKVASRILPVPPGGPEMATIQESAVRLGIPTLELFKRAYARYGLMFGSESAEADHARWLKYQHQVLYVNKYIRDLERQVAVRP